LSKKTDTFKALKDSFILLFIKFRLTARGISFLGTENPTFNVLGLFFKKTIFITPLEKEAPFFKKLLDLYFVF